MAVKVVHVSDISGQEAEEGELGRLVVRQHPDFSDVPVSLEVLPSEVEGLLNEQAAVVAIDYIGPGDSRPRQLLVTVEAFSKLGPDGSMTPILEAARSAQQAQAADASQPRRAGRRTGGTAARGKVDYASLEHAGEPHRGRITEAEKEIVRANLDKINKRLRDAGLREIDPADPKMQERYGLDQKS